MRFPLGLVLSVFVAVGAALGSVSVVHAALTSTTGTTAAEQATPVERSEGNPSRSGKEKCIRSSELAAVLFDVGFRGNNLREAWAIAMRESSGDPTLGPGHPSYNGFDLGLFQLNRTAFSTQSWWDEQALLDPYYNASIAYSMSKGGRSWWPWGLDGQGNTDAGAYRSIWTQEEIDTMITIPFQKYYRAYPCR